MSAETMDCKKWTDSDSNCTAIDDHWLYSLYGAAGALLLTVIIQCIALIVCGCFLVKRRRHRTQDTDAIEASNGHELKTRAENKTDEEQTTKQDTQPAEHTDTHKEDNDSMYDMVTEDMVSKTTQLKKLPAAPSTDYANITLPSTSGNHTSEKTNQQPETAGSSTLPPADVYNPETGGAIENAQYAKVNMAKKTKKKEEPPPPLPPALSNYDEIVHHDSSTADSNTAGDYNKLNHDNRRRTVDFSTLGDGQDCMYDTIEQDSTTKQQKLPAQAKPLSAVSHSQECLPDLYTLPSRSCPPPAGSQPVTKYKPAAAAGDYTSTEPEYDVVPM